MTADIIELGKLPPNAPAPCVDAWPRMYIYKFFGGLEQLDRSSDYTLRRARWSIVRVLADGPELDAVLWMIWGVHRGNIWQEDCTWHIFRFPHYRDPLIPCWGIAGHRKGDLKTYLVSHTHLPSPGIPRGEMIRVYAGNLPCSIKGRGLVGDFEGGRA
jgi:hypothetical protein